MDSVQAVLPTGATNVKTIADRAGVVKWISFTNPATGRLKRVRVRR